MGDTDVGGSVRFTYLVFVSGKVHGESASAHIPCLEGGILASRDEKSAIGGPGALVDLR